MSVEPMTPKALRRLMARPAVERPMGDPDPGELLKLRYVKTREEAKAHRVSRS